MSWFAKIDANWPSHPKAIKAGSKGRDLYIAGLCYCRRHLTDGFIPREALSTLQPGLKSPSAVATLLVRLHLWEQRTDGFVIHDYLDWNDSAADIKATQEAAKKRKREWWHRHLDAVPNASRNASSTTSSTFPTPNKETAASPRGQPGTQVDDRRGEAGHAPTDRRRAGAAFRPLHAGRREPNFGTRPHMTTGEG